MKELGGKLWHLIEIIAHFCLALLFKIMEKELTEQQFDAFMQFVKFGMVGVTSTVVSYLLNIGTLLLLQRFHLFAEFDAEVANINAFILSVPWSFFWNNLFVFKKEEGEHRSILRALMKSYASYAFTGLFLSTILIRLWVSVFHISKFIAPLINLVATVPINFLINKFWAFKSVESREE